MDDITQTSKNLTKSKRKLIKRIIVVLVIILVLVGAGIYVYLQYHSLNNAESAKNDLTAQVKELKANNDALTVTNASLKKSVAALATQEAKQTTTNTTTSTPATENSGILTLKGGSTVHPSYYGNTSATANTDQLNALFFTIKNTSTVSKQFTLFDFTATTDTGEIIKPLVYAGPGSGNFWNNTTLAPGGSTDQSIVFDSKYTLVTLQWAPSGFEVTSLPIPGYATSPVFWTYIR